METRVSTRAGEVGQNTDRHKRAGVGKSKMHSYIYAALFQFRKSTFPVLKDKGRSDGSTL